MPHLSSLPAIILDTALKATVLLALAWASGALLEKRSAAARHLVRALFLATLLMLPFSGFLPGWHVRGIPEFAPTRPELAAKTAVTAAPVAHRLPAPPAMIVTANSPSTTAPASRLQTEHTRPAVAYDVRPAVEPEAWTAAQPVSRRQAKAGATGSSRWPVVLALVWLAGVLFLALRWLASTFSLAALVRRAVPVSDPEWNAQVRKVSCALNVRRSIVLLESQQTEVPLAIGIFRPAVILPPDRREWSDLRRQAILHHEIAHIARLDALTQSVAQAATTLYWFHPLAWLIVRAMRAERERACDDQVLAAGTKPSEYAHELLDIVANLRQPDLAALAMGRRSQLEGRVLAVLNPALRRGPVSRWTSFALALLVLGIVLPLAAIRPARAQSDKTATTPATVGPKAAPAATMAEQLQDLRTRLAAIQSNEDLVVSSDLQALTAETAGLKKDLAAFQSQLNSNPSQNDQLAARLAQLRAKLASLEDQTGMAPEAPEAFEAEAPEAPPAPDFEQEWPGTPGVPAVPTTPSTPAIPSVPTVPSVPSVPAAPGGGELSACGTKAKLHNMTIDSHDGSQRWIASWSGDDCSVELNAEGKIQFNAEATEIQSISSGGFFELNVRQGDNLRRVRVTPSGNGLEFVLKVNGQQQPFDASAKAWFAGFLLSLERSTGFAADTRVPRLLAKGGPTAVLDEINNLTGDYVRGIYFRKLLEQPNLPAPVVVRIINQAGSQIESDYEMARVLMEVAKQYDLPDETSRTTFLKAAGNLKSDYEHSRVLIELLKRPNISAENVGMALNSAASIKSDYEKSRILLSLIDQKAFDQSSLDFYLKLVATIDSDYEKSRDLLAAIERYPLASGQVNQIMDAATK
ncbi:MAG TPA: M56 family metallopeptidase, partial [Terriglobales bacterium]